MLRAISSIPPEMRADEPSVRRIDHVYAARGMTCPISVAPRSLLIRLVTARTLSRISSAVAAHLNGLASAFQSAANRLNRVINRPH